MKRTLCTAAALLVVALTAGCKFKIFEDIGSDPHPPSVSITSINVYVAPVEETTTEDSASLRGKATWDSGGFTLDTAELFQLQITYADAGADIESFHLRDRDGDTQTDITPSANTYFSGTSGALLAGEDGLEITGMAGRHRMELWAVDSHGSRSEKVEFEISLVL